MDNELAEIVVRSMAVNLAATFIACAVAIPIGIAIGVRDTRTALLLRAVARGFLGLPPVVVGLVLYLSLSRSGFFASLDLLYTAAAMVIAQALIVFPIGLALAEGAARSCNKLYWAELKILDVKGMQRGLFFFREMRQDLGVIFFTCFGRALSEVGAVLIVGGNISGVTRMMTTSIAMETSRGNTDNALYLGFFLVSISVGLHLLIFIFRQFR